MQDAVCIGCYHLCRKKSQTLCLYICKCMITEETKDGASLQGRKLGKWGVGRRRNYFTLYFSNHGHVLSIQNFKKLLRRSGEVGGREVTCQVGTKVI